MRLKSERALSYPAMIYPDKEYVSSLASRGFYYNDYIRLPMCYDCEGLDEIHEEKCFIPTLNRIITDLRDVKTNFTDKDLFYRISTFQDGWKSINGKVSCPIEIACAGFCYTGRMDFLQCPFCSIIISFSSLENISLTEHRKLNPNCKFVTEYFLDC